MAAFYCTEESEVERNYKIAWELFFEYVEQSDTKSVELQELTLSKHEKEERG